jgi:two-component system LytT family sensor kinase
MPNTHEPVLVNTIGHSAGAIIFGIFLYLLLRDRAAARLRGSWRTLAAAALAFLWNLGSLAALVASTRSNTEPHVLLAFTFSILSVLPAVLFDLSLENSLRPLVRIGYLLSAVAAAMHFANARTTAFLLITVGFALLTVIALIALAVEHDREGRLKRMAGAMCSALFAISFVHFSSGHAAQAWSKELALHHAGLPLALFVLLQDYRFVLLDAFIRFLANVLLAAVLIFAVIGFASKLVILNGGVASNPLYQALLLIALCLLLIAFALLRSRVQQLLTRVVFRRPDLDGILRDLRSGPALRLGESDYLGWASRRLGDFMGANSAEVISGSTKCPEPSGADIVFPTPLVDVPSLRHDPEFHWAEALVPVRLGPGDTCYILLGRRKGGRRFLSEDFQALSRLSTAIAEQVDRFRASEMQRLVSQAELRALQSQINPHFLFNALNALYGIIPRDAAGARRTVTNLAQVFRYFLQTEKTFIPLSEELEIVKAYLEIEGLRLGPRLETDIQIDDAALPVLIPILSIQPLVENAIRHGLAPSPKKGRLRLRAEARDDGVHIVVQDTGPGMAKTTGQHSGAGVGLANVSRRLKLCYGPDVELDIDSDASGTTVHFAVPLAKMAVQPYAV